MAEHKPTDQPKTLEMRVAELEEKLSKIHITEDELKAYHKVNSLMGGQPPVEAAAPAAATAQLSPQVCVVSRAVSRSVSPRSISPISRGIGECYETVGRAFKGALAAQRRLRGRDTHRPGELSYAQYGLLFALCDGDARSSRELAVAADVSPATAAEMLDGLAASGLVERMRSEDDKRIVLTSLSERGQALVDERRAMYEPRWRAALSQF